jgi:hypothetical protein
MLLLFLRRQARLLQRTLQRLTTPNRLSVLPTLE